MALQTGREHGRALEHLCIHGAVRAVTSLTTIDAHGAVFEHERAAFIDVALETGLFVGLRLVHHTGTRSSAPCGRGGSMRIVAVRALD